MSSLSTPMVSEIRTTFQLLVRNDCLTDDSVSDRFAVPPVDVESVKIGFLLEV